MDNKPYAEDPRLSEANTRGWQQASHTHAYEPIPSQPITPVNDPSLATDVLQKTTPYLMDEARQAAVEQLNAYRRK